MGGGGWSFVCLVFFSLLDARIGCSLEGEREEEVVIGFFVYSIFFFCCVVGVLPGCVMAFSWVYMYVTFLLKNNIVLYIWASTVHFEDSVVYVVFRYAATNTRVVALEGDGPGETSFP
ncbi:hypothetical protein K440DRAFT_288851 [Wilcoxina mikolae CBS 423.85]|nr:hypothetical protein K440DRAFT_288851 [Wilcoxina mikolae CBS 423.85]